MINSLLENKSKDLKNNCKPKDTQSLKIITINQISKITWKY